VSRYHHLSKSAATWTRYRREKSKSKVDKMLKPWFSQNYSGSECHSVTNHPLFGVDGQSIHFETECHSRKLSQSECHSRKMSHGRSVTEKIGTELECHSRKLSHGQSVTVENCHKVRMSQ
jgi:hypothetical protein